MRNAIFLIFLSFSCVACSSRSNTTVSYTHLDVYKRQDALNSSNFAATTVCARRTLEGIFKYLVPEKEQKKPLAQLIEHVKSNNDLAAPLQSLSHAIRDGGNLGAHFDMEKEPDAVIARQMVEFLEYLISYLYVLPKEINALESSLNSNA